MYDIKINGNITNSPDLTIPFDPRRENQNIEDVESC